MKTLKPNEQRAKNSILLLWIMFTLEIISLIFSGYKYYLLSQIQNGLLIDESTTDTFDFIEFA